MKIRQAKELFFAQYLEQEVAVQKSFGYPQILNTRFLDGGINNSYLLLRTVDQLIDEELITVASIVCARHNRHYRPGEVTYKISHKRRFDIIVIVKGNAQYMVQLDSDGVGFVDYYMGGAGHVYHYAPGQYAVTDYFHSIGIIIPFTYLNEENKPITLQPNEIIALEWAKTALTAPI